MKNPEHEQSGIYGSLIAMLAVQREAISVAAFELYFEALERAVDPKDMGIDAALVALDLASPHDTVVDLDGNPVVEYLDPWAPEKKTPAEVRHILLGFHDDDDDDYEGDSA